MFEVKTWGLGKPRMLSWAAAGTGPFRMAMMSSIRRTASLYRAVPSTPSSVLTQQTTVTVCRTLSWTRTMRGTMKADSGRSRLGLESGSSSMNRTIS